jgi:hypothetical protein
MELRPLFAVPKQIQSYHVSKSRETNRRGFRGAPRTATWYKSHRNSRTLLLASAVVCLCTTGWCSKAGATVNTPERVVVSAHSLTTQLQLGITRTQVDIDTPGGSPAANQAAAEILRRTAKYQNVFIMGWGADDPEPEPGKYNWTSLDRRIASIRATGGTPVISLCRAPRWMQDRSTGGKYIDDSSPKPEYFADFAELARQVALRYPDVKYYQVWNEAKGFTNKIEHHPDYQAYTELYNKVYAALKSVSPDIKVGGPYFVFRHTILPVEGQRLSRISGPYGIVSQDDLDGFIYWNKHKLGADFVNVDGNVSASLAPYRHEEARSVPQDLFGSESFFGDVDAWLRTQTTLPIWWAEWYAAPIIPTVPPTLLSDDEQNALLATSVIEMMPTASVALRWSPEATANSRSGAQQGVWTDTRSLDGGRPLPFAYTMEGFARCFPPETEYRLLSSPSIRGAAAAHCAMLINTKPEKVAARYKSRLLTLDPYAVIFVR